MAVTAVEQTNRLRIRFEEGLDPDTGRMKTSSVSWGNVKPAAPDQDVWDVAVALTDLSDKAVYDVFLNEGKLLTE
jgi:hypothetical protein